MSLKLFLSSLGCVIAWMVFLPVGLMGGLALFTYALLAELAQYLVASSDQRIDASTARRMARRMLSPRVARFQTAA